ncbi:MAG TPA: hypothetical protein VK586_21890, partial [Streptosporangiaceae bacterium]|nr:hypothetical protein [Streptosporangiaceae bacterium]
SIRLSVGRIRVRRGLRRRAGLGAVDAPGIQRIAGHLGDCLPSGAAGAALAVVPADDTDVAAVALMALALSCAREGKRVIVADLVPGRPVARLLNVTDPGVKAVSVQDTRMVVVVPEPGDVAAAGPLAPAGPPTATAASARPRPPTADLVSAYSSADVLLTLAAVDPMLGAEHLATWTAGLAVLVTAGESTWTRVQAVGEMIRLSGTRLVTAVLVGADATDESLGIASPPRAGRHLRADEPIADTAQLPRLPQEIRIPLDSSHPADGTPVIPADAGAGPPPPDTR